nr:MAG: hypothetical protein [Penaeus semisulcatus pemonivirus]
MGALPFRHFPALFARPTVSSLRSDALLKVVSVTAYAIEKISLTESKCERELELNLLKCYLSMIPRTVLQDYVDKLESYWYKVYSDLPVNMGSIIIELMLLPGLTHFYTRRWMGVLEIDLYEKITHCSTLRALSLSTMPVCHADVDHLTNVIQRFHRLQSLTLIPFEEGLSFHWAFGPVAQHCRDLRELYIAYQGNAFSDEARGVEQLSQCRGLQSLWLFDISKYTQPQRDKVCILLRELSNLKFFFHREMIPAILQLKEDKQVEGRKLALEHLDTWLEDFHLDISPKIRVKPLGLFRTVLCPESLLSLVDSCPSIKRLTLGRPPSCIDKVVTALPHLRTLELFESELRTCRLGDALLKDGLLRHLTVLGLTEIPDLDYEFFSILANECPVLEVLNISRSCISREGRLNVPNIRPFAFPCLRELTLTRRVDTLISEGVSTFRGVWHMGRALLLYLLTGSFKISKIHVQFDMFQLEQSDIPSWEFLKEVILPFDRLTCLHLINPPDYEEEKMLSFIRCINRSLVRYVIEYFTFM